MTIRLSLFALVFVAGLATTASATRFTPPYQPFANEALQHLSLLDFVDAEMHKEAARQWLSQLLSEDRETLLDTMARRLGGLAGDLNELVAKASAPETREDVLLLSVEMACMWRKASGMEEKERRWEERHRFLWSDSASADEGISCPRVLVQGDFEFGSSEGRSRSRLGVDLLDDPTNAILLSLISTEYNGKKMRKWFSELSPEKRSNLMAEFVVGTLWLAEYADSFDRLAAQAAAPETREDVFVLIAQKACEEERESRAARYGWDNPSPWCRQLPDTPRGDIR